MEKRLRRKQRKPWRRRILTAGIVVAILASVLYAVGVATKDDPQTSASQGAAGQEKTIQPADIAAGELAPDEADLGLQTLLDTIAADKGDYAIAVAEPEGRQAATHGDKQYTATSTYKLFIAYGVFQRINSGAMEWSDSIVGGNDADECFELMIVQSNNDCVNAFGNRIGWQAVDTMMDQLGLTDTQVKYQDNVTTANDLALFLTKLQNGTLLNGTDSQKLLDAMKRQIYRRGIPAGTGVTVADKPGFLGALLHDAGIVYGPKGEYVLVILSDDSSWNELADAAKQVHNYLQQ